MRRTLFGIVASTLLFSLVALAQPEAGYFDIGIAKVKPEKRAECDAIMKRMVDANRLHKGDAWTTSETIYGDFNTVYFVSLRRSYAEAEQGFDAFFSALAKAAGGPAGGAKMWQEFNNCVSSYRAEFRVRRLDLSSNAPADQAGLVKLIGQS